MSVSFAHVLQMTWLKPILALARISNASSLVDFLFIRLHLTIPLDPLFFFKGGFKVTLLRFSFLSIPIVGFSFSTTSQYGRFFFIPLPSVGGEDRKPSGDRSEGLLDISIRNGGGLRLFTFNTSPLLL